MILLCCGLPAPGIGRQAFPLLGDAAIAAQEAYLQNGSHPPETYAAIQPIAVEWLRRSYARFRNADLTIMRCIDFAESAEIGRLARRTLPRRR